MILPLQIISSKPAKLILGRSRPWRIAFAGIALFLCAGMIITRDAPFLSIIIIALSLFASLYEDTWKFDRETATLYIARGIGPLCHKKTYIIEDFSHISLKSAVSSSFGKPKGRNTKDPLFYELFRKGRASLWIIFKDPEEPRLLIDDGSYRDTDSLRNLGLAAAAWCDVPFEGLDEKFDTPRKSTDEGL